MKNSLATTSPKIANVIEIRNGKPMVSSLTLASMFERPHFRVLRSIKRLVNRGKLTTGAVVSSWLDSTGRSNELYLLDERSSLIAAPFIGGANAEDVQCRLVDAYLYYRDAFANPPRADLVRTKRDASHILTDSILEWRTDHDKPTNDVHYMSEQKLCNWAVCGAFQKLDESSLSNEDLELLRRVRERNAALIVSGIEYRDRKARLFDFATRVRTKLVLKEAA